MTTSPERCLGGLIKDIDKDLSPRELDFYSKDETTYKTSSEQKLFRLYIFFYFTFFIFFTFFRR